MKKLLFFSLVLLCYLLPNNPAVAADPVRQLSVTVLDYDINHKPIGFPGVTVVVNGPNGKICDTSTDLDGNAKIYSSSIEDAATFSHIGYKTQKVRIGNKAHIQIVMIPDDTFEENSLEYPW